MSDMNIHMEIAPDNLTVLSVLSIVVALITPIFVVSLMYTGFITIGDDIPDSGSIDVAVSQQNEEVRFKVVSLGDSDYYVIEEPSGKSHRLESPDDFVGLEVEDGVYSIVAVYGDTRRVHQTVNPSVDNIEITQNQRGGDGELISDK